MKYLAPLSLLAKVSVSAGLMLSLSGCFFGEEDDLQRYIEEVKARSGSPIEPIPEIKPYVRFIYPGHELNPFDPKILAPDPAQEVGSTVKPDPNRLPEFLESFPLDSLQMVGTVNQGGEPWALIKIPDGAVHRAKVGNYLGKNYGKINKIEDTKVIVAEMVENGFGGYKEQEASIALTSIEASQPKK